LYILDEKVKIVVKVQTERYRCGDWAGGNEMKINPNKIKALSFTTARVKDTINHSLGEQKVPEVICYNYVGIMIRNDLSWNDQGNFTVQKVLRDLHFVMRIVQKGNKNAKSLAYTSPARPILEYGAACWDPYRECQVSALDPTQNRSAKFVQLSGGSDWESLAQLRKIARICTLYKAYTGDRTWKAIGDRLQAPSHLNRFDHYWTIIARKPRRDIGKYSYVNRSITD